MIGIISFAVYALFPLGNAFVQAIRTQDDPLAVQSGKEVIYSYIDKGSIEVADNIVANSYEVSRFDPVTIEELTWEEDPYSDLYWRFNYYNLEPVRHLLYAWEITDNVVYKNKLIEITESFIDDGMEGSYSWDYHGVAFRTMTLVDVWKKLDRKGELNEALDAKIMDALEVHGEFLANPNHFEGGYNHGLDQAAALYLIAVNFPDLPKGSVWLDLSAERISILIGNIIGDDGILVENSPYYHFYVLEKLWEISSYTKKYDLPEFTTLESKLDDVIAYATYILHPDSTIPTIGASLQRSVNFSGLYKEMAAERPELQYTLTKGKDGTKPQNLHLHYKDSGQTIMRSGWEKGSKFEKQTQLIFDIGNYRTNHSDLDALSFSLYGAGIPLLPDVGLHSYEPGPYRSYFHGTRAHNTVVVDGQDQASGEHTAGSRRQVHQGEFFGTSDYAYQSGEHELYRSVSHKRAIMIIEDNTVLVFDKLTSDTEHSYEQMFHLYPNATITTANTTLHASWGDGEQQLTIEQLGQGNIELNYAIDQQEPIDGLCSFEYKKTTPCHSVSYEQREVSASYITMITIGDSRAKAELNEETDTLRITTKKNTYTINISESEEVKDSIEVIKGYDTAATYNTLPLADSLQNNAEWFNTFLSSSEESNTTEAGFIFGYEDGGLNLIPPLNGEGIEAETKTTLDLSNKELYFRYKIDNVLSLDSLNLRLSNNNWEKYAEYDLTNFAYQRDEEWLTFGVGKGEQRKISLGNWEKNDSTFDWGAVDALAFYAESNEGEVVRITAKEFRLAPSQTEARAVIIFDDGWDSILKTLPAMNAYGMRGNVGAITITTGVRGYLTLDELKMLQNEHNWDIVSHTYLHNDAVLDYTRKNDLEGYEQDITDALRYLIQHDINSAPNWFIYPFGSIDSKTKSVVGKYYKFARATIDAPEQYPFPDPLETKILSAYSDQATNQDILNAITDGAEQNHLLMLLFHKITEGKPTVHTEWNLSEFQEILEHIHRLGIKVVTLSELDEENGVPQTKFVLHDFIPSQIKLDVEVTPQSFFDAFLSNNE